MFCSKCGKEIAAGAQFCGSCGQPVASPQVAAPRGFVGWLRGLKTWKKVLLGIGIFIVAVVGLALYATSGLDEPVKRHFAALHTGDIDGAYAELSVAARQTTSPEQFRAMLGANPALMHVTGTSFAERSYENSQGHLTGMLEIENGGQLPIEVSLVKESGAWRILAYHVRGAGANQPPPDTESNRP